MSVEGKNHIRTEFRRNIRCRVLKLVRQNQSDTSRRLFWPRKGDAGSERRDQTEISGEASQGSCDVGESSYSGVDQIRKDSLSGMLDFFSYVLRTYNLVGLLTNFLGLKTPERLSIYLLSLIKKVYTSVIEGKPAFVKYESLQ